MYNLTQINGTGMAALMSSTNNVIMGGFLGLLLLIMIGGILFINFYRFNGKADKSFVGTAFICFILSILLFFMGLVDQLVIYVMLIMVAGGIIFIWNNQ